MCVFASVCVSETENVTLFTQVEKIEIGFVVVVDVKTNSQQLQYSKNMQQI